MHMVVSLLFRHTPCYTNIATRSLLCCEAGEREHATHRLGNLFPCEMLSAPYNPQTEYQPQKETCHPPQQGVLGCPQALGAGIRLQQLLEEVAKGLKTEVGLVLDAVPGVYVAVDLAVSGVEAIRGGACECDTACCCGIVLGWRGPAKVASGEGAQVHTCHPLSEVMTGHPQRPSASFVWLAAMQPLIHNNSHAQPAHHRTHL
jgi:hypothetical protein